MEPKLTWQSLLNSQRIKLHRVSPQELDDLRAVVERDLSDAGIEGLSTDRRFATAYNAVLQLAKMVIACEGYRAAGFAHHQTTLEALELAMGGAVSDLTAYFDTCRRKRNQVDCDMADVATEAELDDLMRKAHEFRALVEKWIRSNHPQHGL